MKNNMKKIIVGIFAFTLLFIGSKSVFASSVWNGVSGDCPDINIANYTENEGYGNPCWYGTNVSADAGDVINVKVYYHNTSSATATNTRIKISAPTGSSTSHSFIGQIISDQGNLSTGSVKVNISSSQSLTLSSVKWYPNQSSSAQTPSGSITGSGVSIGDIAPGWDSQGTVVAVFKISNNTTAELCKDTSADNYGENLPCQYVSRCSISKFSASDTYITNGESSTLSWVTSYCQKVSISNIGNVSNSGSKVVYPSNTTNYILTAVGINEVNTVNKTVQIQVEDLIIEEDDPTGNISASPSSCQISSGNSSCSSTLSWHTNDPIGTSAVTKSGSTIATGNSGSKTVSVVYGTSTYYLYNNSKELSRTSVSASCEYGTNWNGSYCAGSVVEEDECYILSFYTGNSYITEGDSTKIIWNTKGCTSISISNIGNVNSTGSESISPINTTTYKLSAYSSNGNVKTKTLTINVSENNDNDEEDDDCSISSFSASDTSIEEGDSVKLKWNTNSCDYVKITDLGSVSDDGSDYVYPDSDTTYKITAYNSGSSKHTKSISISVDENNDDYNDVVYNTSVVTTIATNVSETGATLNGLVTTNVKNNTNTYFEYGPTQNLGFRTSSKSINGSSYINQYVSGLNPNTIYYFRAVSENGTGTTRGATSVFQTLNSNVNYNTNTTQTTKYVYIGGTTVTGSASPIMLTIENKYSYIERGDFIDYTIYYKNIGKSILKDSVLQVIVPEYITITNSSDGTYSNDTHALSVELGDLQTGEDGTVYMQGVVKSIPSNLAKVVTSAVLVYTNKNGAQENAMAYVLNMPNRNNNLLGASVFFSGFGGIGLIGWLIIIILILIIILIVRRLTEKRDEQNNQSHQ